VEGVRAFQPALQVNRTLRELGLRMCSIRDDSVGLLADSLDGNTTIEILNIGHNQISSDGLDDITRLLESTQLRKVDLQLNHGLFIVEAASRRFARVLSRHEFLKDLNLHYCQLGNGGIHIIVNGLVDNAILEVLTITWNYITLAGLADVTRLIESTMTGLKKIDFVDSIDGVFNDENTTQHFSATLIKNSTIVELPHIDAQHLPAPQHVGLVTTTSIVCARNKCLNHVNLLLAPPQRPQQQHGTTSTNLFLLKLWHKAIAKLAMAGPRGSNAGASAIFKLFQSRSQLLEKRIKRHVTATIAATESVSQEQKRPRL
jgi:Leucine Rich repeat